MQEFPDQGIAHVGRRLRAGVENLHGFGAQPRVGRILRRGEQQHADFLIVEAARNDALARLIEHDVDASLGLGFDIPNTRGRLHHSGLERSAAVTRGERQSGDAEPQRDQSQRTCGLQPPGPGAARQSVCKLFPPTALRGGVSAGFLFD